MQDFDALHALVPQNCLVGENDVIPGLELETFPRPQIVYTTPEWQKEKPSAKPNPQFVWPNKTLVTNPKKDLWLHNITLQHNPEFDTGFQKFARKLMFKLNRWSLDDPKNEKLPDPIISDRQIVAQVTSPWREISDSVEIKKLVHK